MFISLLPQVVMLLFWGDVCWSVYFSFFQNKHLHIKGLIGVNILYTSICHSLPIETQNKNSVASKRFIFRPFILYHFALNNEVCLDTVYFFLLRAFDLSYPKNKISTLWRNGTSEKKQNTFLLCFLTLYFVIFKKGQKKNHCRVSSVFLH